MLRLLLYLHPDRQNLQNRRIVMVVQQLDSERTWPQVTRTCGRTRIWPRVFTTRAVEHSTSGASAGKPR